MDDGTRFEFNVRYRPAEYLSTVRAHLYATVLPKNPGWWTRLNLTLILGAVILPLFAWKSLRVGRCRFEMDASGFTRHSRGGPQYIAWAQVRKLHWYPHAVLMQLGESEVPVPYRVLQPGQREQLACWVAEASPGSAP